MKKFYLGKGKIWFIVSLVILVTAGYFIQKNLSHPVLWFILFILLYLAACFFIFFYELLGEYSVLCHMMGKYDEARRYSEVSAVKSGKSANALNLCGIYRLQDGKPDEALTYFERADRINKNPVMHKNITVSIASCYWVKGDVDRGIKVIKDMLPKYDYINPDVYTTLGYMYILKEDYENALKYTNLAIDEKQNHAPAYDNLGQISLRKADNEEAKAYFQKALFYNPGMTDSKYYLALVYDKEGNAAEAKRLIESAKGDYLNSLNTVTREMIDELYDKYNEETEKESENK